MACAVMVMIVSRCSVIAANGDVGVVLTLGRLPMYFPARAAQPREMGTAVE
jgi:hypothetical protein